MNEHRDIQILPMAKGDERYVFAYRQKNVSDLLRRLGNMAANPELSFSWFDVAMLSQKIRRTTQEAGKGD